MINLPAQDATITVEFGGQPIAIDIGENTALAAQYAGTATAKASEASTAADRAEVAGSLDRYFATIATGVAATTAPATFTSDESGSLVWYDADGNAIGAPALASDVDALELLVSPLSQDANVTLTVGTTGQFSTLNDALKEAAKYRFLYESNGRAVNINILNDGWVMQEQVIANGIDLGFIRITSDQAQVTIDRASVTELAGLPDFAGVTVKPAAFMGTNAVLLPRIACKFAMNATGTSLDQCGILLMKGSRMVVEPLAGFHDCDGLGAHVIYGSSLYATETEWSGNGVGGDAYFAGGVRGDWIATLVLAEANVHDNVGQGIMANGGTLLTLRDGFCTGNGDDGVQGGTGSILHLRGAQINNNGGRGVFLDEKCTARLLGSQVNNNTGTGVQIASGSNLSAINGTQITGNGSFGIRGSGYASLSGCTITGNNLQGVRWDQGECEIISGTISGNGTKDFTVEGGNIKLSGAVTSTSGSTAANNLTDSNVSAFNVPRNNGTGMIYGRGGKASNRGTATITGANTSVTVTHGVDFSPLLNEVQVTPQASLGTAAKFWVSGMTATQFTINVDTAPGSSVPFGWQLTRNVG